MNQLRVSTVIRRVVVAVLFAGASANAAWPFGSSKKDAAKQVKASEPSGADAAVPAAVPAVNSIDFGGEIVTNKNGQFVMRPHLRLDEKAETEFRMLLGMRIQTTEDLYVLKRLAEEKQQEAVRFAEQLKADFAIDDKANYEYDNDSGTIVQLILKPGAATNDVSTNAAAAYDRKEHRKLPNKEDQERFVRLVASKQLSLDEIQTITLLFKEKTIEMQMLQNSINKKYATSSDRNYRYDRDTRTLYELVPVPEAAAGVTSAINSEAKQEK